MCGLICIYLLIYGIFGAPDNNGLIFIASGLFAIGAEISAAFNKKE